MQHFSRRNFVGLAGVAAQSRLLGQQQYPPPVAAPPIYPYQDRSAVALIKGDNRRKNVSQALLAIDREIRPGLSRKKYVVIKINNVSTTNQLAATHVDAVRGILDYLAPRVKGPVMIVESSAGDTLEGFENFKYAQVISEYKPLQISLVDLNRERKFEIFNIVDRNIRPIPVRLAARMLDPDAYVISSAMLKTHNAVVATMSIKNMVIGTPLHSVAGERPAWSDKGQYHAGPAPGSAAREPNFHAMNYSMGISAVHLKPHWGAAVIDGYEGMEGNGPSSGSPVPTRVALASTDYLAADRVGLEVMGIPPHAVGYLQYASQLGAGQFDLSRIEIRGEKPDSVRRVFKLHDTAERQLAWLQNS
jgi:uncharacterized protein (DUF362 family)